MRTDAALDEANLLRFAELIDSRLGLRFDDSSLKELAAILRARARILRCASVDAYLHRFDAPGSMPDELRALASMLTIGETYFFAAPSNSPCSPRLPCRAWRALSPAAKFGFCRRDAPPAKSLIPWRSRCASLARRRPRRFRFSAST